MTNELEKTFFDTFGIGAYYKYLLIDKTSKFHNEKLFDKTNFIDFIKSGKDYLLLKVIKYPPQITDHILLELICILSERPISISFDTLMLGASDVEKLKGYILLACIGFAKDIKQQVQALFEEEK